MKFAAVTLQFHRKVLLTEACSHSTFKQSEA